MKVPPAFGAAFKRLCNTKALPSGRRRSPARSAARTPGFAAQLRRPITDSSGARLNAWGTSKPSPTERSCPRRTLPRYRGDCARRHARPASGDKQHCASWFRRSSLRGSRASTGRGASQLLASTLVEAGESDDRVPFPRVELPAPQARAAHSRNAAARTRTRSPLLPKVTIAFVAIR